MTNKLKLVTTITINYEIEADTPLEAMNKFYALPESERKFFEESKPKIEEKVLMEVSPLEFE